MSRQRAAALDTRHDGLTVPASAVQQGLKGAYAYVIKPNNTVEIRPITVAQISDGKLSSTPDLRRTNGS